MKFTAIPTVLRQLLERIGNGVRLRSKRDVHAGNVPAEQQQPNLFPTRTNKRTRLFKAIVIAVTAFVSVGLVSMSPSGMYFVKNAARQLTRFAQRVQPDSSNNIDEYRHQQEEKWRDEWRIEAELNVSRAKQNLTAFYQRQSPEFQKFLDISGMAPPGNRQEALFVPTNITWGTVISSRVFIAHPNRGYTLRPNQKAIWTDFHLKDPAVSTCFFLIPYERELLDCLDVAGLSGHVVAGSEQQTNSWGFRGTEPDPAAECRILVLGDSYMQGLFLAEQDTPAMQLQRCLERDLSETVSVLNASVMGYGPSEYFDMFTECVSTFNPHVVIVSICANDLGTNASDVLNGEGNNWDQAIFFCQRIRTECLQRRIHCVFCPITEPVVLLPHSGRSYHDRLMDRLHASWYEFCTVSEPMARHEMEVDPEFARTGIRSKPTELVASDGYHYSRVASQIWGQTLAAFLRPRLSKTSPPDQ